MCLMLLQVVHGQDTQPLVTEIEWNADASQIAVGYIDGRLEIWDVSTRQVETTLTGHRYTITDLAWHPTDNQQLLSSSTRELFLWDISSGQLLTDLHAAYDFPTSITNVTWYPDGHRLIISTSAGAPGIQIWDVYTHQFLSGLYNLTPAQEIVWSSDGTQVLFVGIGGGISIHDSETLAELVSVISEDFLVNAAWSANTLLVVTSSWTGNVQIWDVSTGKFQLVQTVQNDKSIQPNSPNTYVQALQFSQDNTELYVLNGDGSFITWDVETGQSQETFQLVNQPIFAADFSLDSNQLAHSSDEGTLEVVEIRIRVPAD